MSRAAPCAWSPLLPALPALSWGPREQPGLEPVPGARCISSRGRPPAQIPWSSHLGGKANNSQEPGLLPGLCAVISLFTLTPSSPADGESVTCRVDHESFEDPDLLPRILSITCPPEVSVSSYSDNWYLGHSEASLNCDVRRSCPCS